MFNNKKRIKNIALAVWGICVGVYFILMSATNSAVADTLSILVLLLGIGAFCVFSASLLYLALKSNGLKEGSKVLIGHALLVFSIFASIFMFALMLWGSTTETLVEDTEAKDVVELKRIEPESQNIECYIDGKKVFTDRETCRQLSEKEPEKVVETEVKYVPTPTRPSYTPTVTDTTKKEPIELKQTCTECSTDHTGTIRCNTYKAYFCPKP